MKRDAFVHKWSHTMCDERGIELQVVPGEAHVRLGIIERHHLVMRAAIETYMETEKLELTIQNVREAVDHVAPALNTLSFNKATPPHNGY